MLKIKSHRIDRGMRWVAKDGERYIGSFGYIFLPNNSGALFDRNHGDGSARLYVAIGNTYVIETRIRAQFDRTAQKLARQWFRTVNARAIIRAAWLAGEVL